MINDLLSYHPIGGEEKRRDEQYEKLDAVGSVQDDQ
jgi:hypothetical protein